MLSAPHYSTNWDAEMSLGPAPVPAAAAALTQELGHLQSVSPYLSLSEQLGPVCHSWQGMVAFRPSLSCFIECVELMSNLCLCESQLLMYHFWQMPWLKQRHVAF